MKLMSPYLSYDKKDISFCNGTIKPFIYNLGYIVCDYV